MLKLVFLGVDSMAREYPEVVGLRVTPLEKAALHAAAKAEGKPMSEFLRGLVVPPVTERLTSGDAGGRSAAA
jgi:hypothetical protein